MLKRPKPDPSDPGALGQAWSRTEQLSLMACLFGAAIALVLGICASLGKV